MSEIQTIEVETSLKLKGKSSEQVERLDGNIDFLGKAKKLNSEDIAGKARLVLDGALHNSHSNAGNAICQEVYDSCVSGSITAELTGVWTITKVYGSNSKIWNCSGAIFYVTDQLTDAGQYISASFVAGPEPTGAQKVK